MPKVLGRYHIISELGRGGMGVVYKAVDPKLERFIAIKCLSEELSSDEITVTRFLREARNVAALNHPHIAQIFLADEDEGRPYFVMEYIDGESLAERLARDKRLMPEQAVRIVTECAEALKAAHEENIVHRDIKPGNIMIDRRGRAVLTDFGIASIVRPDKPATSKYIMGTPGYLPPEVMTGQPADHRGDIFALGAVYYEMLAGKRLVPGRDIEDTARTLLAADFPELGDLDGQLDEVSFGVLGRMLAPDPDKRYQDFDALLAGLRSEPVAVPRPKSTPVATAPDSEPTKLATPLPISRTAADQAPTPSTESIDPESVKPAATQSAPPPARRHRARSLGLVGVLMLSLILVGLGVARMAPERWDQVTDRVAGLFGSDTADATGPGELAVASSDSDRAPFQVDSEGHDVGGLEFGLVEPALSASSARLMTSETAAPDSEPETGQSTTASAAHESPEDPSHPADRQATAIEEPPEEPTPVVSPVETPSDRLVVATSSSASSSSTTPQPRPETRPPPARPAATGIVVLGLGDPIFVDPMVREIEEALRADGRQIVERGYIPGLSALVGEPEIDLAALADAAASADARFAVVVRAMPAGQRQLEYHGRTDTSFIVQTETITYDLASRQRLGASELEQIEYTTLNATRQARDSIMPKLAGISEQLVR